MAKRCVLGPNVVNVGADYTEEEKEFLLAIDRYKRRHHRPFPTWLEVLDVLRSLGWRKVPPPGTERT
jgi:hypothetical protein